jgi:hypothetical protein
MLPCYFGAALHAGTIPFYSDETTVTGGTKMTTKFIVYFDSISISK